MYDLLNDSVNAPPNERVKSCENERIRCNRASNHVHKAGYSPQIDRCHCPNSRYCQANFLYAIALTHNEYQLTDALQLMVEYGERMRVEYINALHCGTSDQLLAANRSILEKRASQIYRFPNSVIVPPVFIGEGAIIERAVIGPYASIGNGARVVNSIIKDTIIHPNADLQNVLINQSLIGPDARLYGGFHRFNVDSSSQIDLSYRVD